MKIKGLDHLNLSVKNVRDSADWYRRVFGFEQVEGGTYQGRPWAILKAGEAMLCVYEDPERQFLDSDQLKGHRLHGINHFAFRITDREAWEATIKRENVKLSFDKYRYPHSDSWYVCDPTGYEIEVALWDNDTIKFN